MPRGTRRAILVSGLLAALLAAFLASICLGAVPIGPLDVSRILAYQLPGTAHFIIPDWSASNEAIVVQIRLPRVILALIVGASLALAGAVFQGLFRNPMADPQVIGASAGAALGAAIAIVLQNSLQWHFLGSIPLLASIGAILTVILVYNLARTGAMVPMANLLLAGIAVHALMSAIVSLIMYYGQDKLHTIVFWLMGGLSGRDWHYILFTLPCLIAGLAITAYYSRDLNLMLIGEETAATIGVEVEKVKAVLLFTASVLTGVSVAASGMIGFVGLVVPHLMRMLAGPDHRLLVPVCVMAGALVLAVADLAARTLVAPTELPLGVVTALFGAPFFLYLLRRYRGSLF